MPESEQNALFWQPDKGRPWLKIVGAIVAVLVVIGVVMFLVSGGEESQAQPDPAPSATAPVPSPTGKATAAPKPEPAKPTPPTPKPESPKPAPAPPAKPPENIDQCVAKHFAPDAFDADKLPKFEFICTASDPRRGAMGLKARLVYAQRKGGPVTDAMKEWSILNWYELAFVSIVQQACCAEPPELYSKSKTCEFDAKITAIGIAGRSGKDIDEAMSAYDKAVQCLINFGMSGHYKQKHPTYGPERDAFKRISERSRK